MSPHTESAGRRLVKWLRAGRPEGVAHGDYIALMSVLHRRLTTAEVEDIAVSLVERDYDDELITEDEIRAMIDEKVHEEATDDDIARIAHLLEEAGVHVDPGVPGVTH
ncbi:MAG: DUF3349 domain-containing protein [Dermatophilaceae bacterium]|jgi:hypothetical protein